MFDKAKKQKQQKLNRNALRMFSHILTQQPLQIMLKNYPNITQLNFLRACTNMHLNYIIFSYIEALQKANTINQVTILNNNTKTNTKNNFKNVQQQVPIAKNIGIQSIKIGIIGGGVMGRLFLNSLLVLQKDGIQSSNLMISTRQVQDLQSYTNMFKVNVEFDNQKIAEQADIIIITTPATLDNWVIMDLKQILKNRINTPSLTTISDKTSKNGNNLNPLVYITTSNMTKYKLSKLFDFPIITPFVKGHDTQYLNSLVNQSKNWNNNDSQAYIEQLQKHIQQKIRSNVEQVKQALSFAFEKYLVSVKDRKYSTINQSQRNSKSGKTINLNDKIILIQNKTQRVDRPNDKQKQKEQQKQSQKGLSKKSSVNLSSYSYSVNNNYNIEMAKNLVQQVMSQNNNIKQTFLKRCRKWRMAYNNFIA